MLGSNRQPGARGAHMTETMDSLADSFAAVYLRRVRSSSSRCLARQRQPTYLPSRVCDARSTSPSLRGHCVPGCVQCNWRAPRDMWVGQTSGQPRQHDLPTRKSDEMRMPLGRQSCGTTHICACHHMHSRILARMPSPVCSTQTPTPLSLSSSPSFPRGARFVVIGRTLRRRPHDEESCEPDIAFFVLFHFP